MRDEPTRVRLYASDAVPPAEHEFGHPGAAIIATPPVTVPLWSAGYPAGVMLRVATVAVLGLVLAGCGADTAPVSATPRESPIVDGPLEFPPEVTFPPDMVRPPATVLNGINGRTATVCGERFGGCLNVSDPPRAEGLPLVLPPFHLAIPEGTTVASATAWVMGRELEGQGLGFSDTRLGTPPDGTYAIDVLVAWPDGSHVVYQWGLAPRDH